MLGQKQPDIWLSATDWARLAVDLGLVKTVIPPADRDSEEGRKRGVGVVLSAHHDETFVAEDDNLRLTLRLEKRKARFDGEEPHVRYRFAVISQEDLPEEKEQPCRQFRQTHFDFSDDGNGQSHVGTVWEEI